LRHYSEDFGQLAIKIQPFQTIIPIASEPISTILMGMMGSSCSTSPAIPLSDTIIKCQDDDYGLTE
jgi:hypothetical protein